MEIAGYGLADIALAYGAGALAWAFLLGIFTVGLRWEWRVLPELALWPFSVAFTVGLLVRRIFA